MYVKNQNFFVLGVSKSGFAAASHILKSGGRCRFYEELQSEKIDRATKELESLGGTRVTEETLDDALKDSDVMVISPGVPINHAAAVKAKAMGKRIIGEAEYAFEAISPVIVGVTGTNGKTTTVSMIKAILDAAGVKSELVGNVGVPVSATISSAEKGEIFVTELSSFQLESVSELKPHVSCVLNVAPDHLERHYTMENYVFLKKRIFKNQKESEYAVLNYDDAVVRGFFPEIKAKVAWVSVEQKTDGAYALDGRLFYKEEQIVRADELPFSGMHNVYDALFAIATAKLLGIDGAVIAEALRTFRGVPHRVELVAEIDGVRYYDDSKATNTASAVSAVRTMTRPTVLILGGSEKGEKYDALFSEIKNSLVVHTVITGASRFNMSEAAVKAGVPRFTVTENFASAVEVAAAVAGDGENVLLSPACASFDEFGNFEERGDAFKKIVESFA